jgi:hypothetical protein
MVQTAMQEHIDWLKKQLQKCLDEGYSVIAYKLALEHAESKLSKEREQIVESYKTGIWDVGCGAADSDKYYKRTFKSE